MRQTRIRRGMAWLVALVALLIPTVVASRTAQAWYFDQETGNYFARARIYNPHLGRFLQQDPNSIGVIPQPVMSFHGQAPGVFIALNPQDQYSDGMSLYQYVQSNPVNRRDPSGMFSLLELGNTMATSAYVRAMSFGIAHPLAMRFAGGLLAAANLYAFAQYEEAQAIILSQPNPLGFLAGEAATLRLAVQDIASAGGSLVGLTRAGTEAQGLAASATKFVQAEMAAQTTVRIEVSRARWPEAARHIADAQAAGKPRVLTVDRAGTAARRSAAQSGLPKVPGKDLDEYPPAVFMEGGSGASVRPISVHDNRGVGWLLSRELDNLSDGTRVIIEVGP